MKPRFIIENPLIFNFATKQGKVWITRNLHRLPTRTEVPKVGAPKGRVARVLKNIQIYMKSEQEVDMKVNGEQRDIKENKSRNRTY